MTGSDLLVEVEPVAQGAGPLHMKLVLFAKFRRVRVVVLGRQRQFEPRSGTLRLTGAKIRVWKTRRFEVSLDP